MRPSRSNWLWTAALIALGAALAGQALGWLPPGLWRAVLPLWPALLAAIGLRMWLGPRTNLVVSISAGLVGLSLLAAAFRAHLPDSTPAQILTQYVGTARSAEVRLQLRAVELNLAALDDETQLMRGSAGAAPGQALAQTYAIEGDTGTLTLTQRLDDVLAPFLTGDLAPPWNVGLTPGLPLALTVRTEAGLLNLDLSSTELTLLDLATGAANARVIFPARAATARLRSTSGDITLTLPPEVPVRLTVRARADRMQIPPFLIRNGVVFLSPGFTPAAPFLDVDVSSATGRVIVE